MNKTLLFISILWTAIYSAQPVKVTAWAPGWAGVQNYNGLQVNNHSVIFLELQNSQGNQMKEWTLSFRVNGNITNGSKNFPPSSLKFQFSYLTSNGPNSDGVYPTPGNMGLITSPVPFPALNTPTDLVKNSKYSFQVNNKYFSTNLNYHLIIDGGAYLQEYYSAQNYVVNLMIELKNAKGELQASAPLRFEMQIMPSGPPPNSPTYGIQFDQTAKNVLLEFKTANDYANGVSKTLIKAFSTFSNTPYVVRVNTLNTNLISNTNKTLPVNAVKLSVRDNQNQTVTGTVNLSSSQQNVLTSGLHSTPKFFDTIYSTQAGDPTFFNKSSEQYSGTLVYTMIPQ